MSAPETPYAPLFDDNPAEEDLLGFAGVADAIVRVLTAGGLDPVTVGVQGAWGGGKSTVLNLVAKQLKGSAQVLVVRVDPWEFEDSEDVRGTLIALVLNELQTHLLIDSEDPLPEDVKTRVIKKLDDLRRRIAWGRVAKVLVTSAVTMTPNIGGLVEALTPEPPPDQGEAPDPAKPQSMAGFRDEFAALMADEGLGIAKVVVLVDDLDRCLPPAAVGTLEAIKLFLSVKKMAFVLAADEDLVRASIDAHLGGLANGDFAARYTEKIVQIPVSLPVLSQHDAEAYVALLMARGSQMTAGQVTASLERAAARRREGRAPYVVAGDDGTPDPSVLTLAGTVAHGLSADMWGTPRAVKRFLNNLAIREHIARAAGADLALDVLVRMYVLELRHPTEFKTLVGLPPDKRAELLQQWEDWAAERGDAEPPKGVDERLRDWAETQPPLASHAAAIDRYLSVAATLRSDLRFGGVMASAQREVVEKLLSESDAVRRSAVETVCGMRPDEQDIVVSALGEQLARAGDPEFAIWSISRLAQAEPRLTSAATTVLSSRAVLRRLVPHHVPLVAELQDVLRAIVSAVPPLNELVVRAATEHLNGS